MTSIAILTPHDHHHAQAMQLALELELPIIHSISSDYDYLLEYHAGRLQLIDNSGSRVGPLSVDFAKGSVGFRGNPDRVRQELLIRAVGLLKHPHFSVLDATAGLGQDAFMLAAIGAPITLLENSPVVWALLRDGIERALQDEKIAHIASRLQLLHADAKKWMEATDLRFDVVYLDPMFPEKRKSALSKKEMQYLQVVATLTPDEKALFQAAKACALKRIVVKRPKLAGNFADLAPSYRVTGQSTRFDVYIIDGNSA